MKSHKHFLLNVIVLLFLCSSAYAQTCYDPNYGYYDCDQNYSYYPDQDAAFLEGAILGAVVGGYLYSGDNGGHHWNGNRGGGGGGWQRGGGGGHRGGGGPHHH